MAHAERSVEEASTFALAHYGIVSAPIDTGGGSSPSYDPGPAGGGSFGGGGSTDGWDEGAAFSADDYAAFDRTVAADRDDPRGSYDS